MILRISLVTSSQRLGLTAASEGQLENNTKQVTKPDSRFSEGNPWAEMAGIIEPLRLVAICRT